jgi:hypothetical protein
VHQIVLKKVKVLVFTDSTEGFLNSLPDPLISTANVLAHTLNDLNRIVAVLREHPVNL